MGGKSKFKQNNVQIWFLDEDLSKSAQYLCDIALEKTLGGCFAALVDAVFYFIGIRNKKAHAFYLGRDRKDETMNRFFPCWPFRQLPQFRYYTSRASKWTRQCREHFDYVLEYMNRLLDEYEYRKGRRHKLALFAEWAACDMPVDIPKAGLSKVVPPWKNLKVRFRRSDILEGYRLQYIDTFCWENPFEAYKDVNRDLPEFISRHFALDTSSMVS